MVQIAVARMNMKQAEVAYDVTNNQVERQQRTLTYRLRIRNPLYNSRVRRLDALVGRIDWLRKNERN